MRRWVEQFDGIARSGIENELRTDGLNGDIVPELQAGIAKSLNFGLKVFHLDVNRFPAAANGLTTAEHYSVAGTGLAAE